MEQSLWFEGARERLFGVYHAAAGSGPPPAALVFVHSLFEEKKSAHRIMVDTARTLAAAGIAVLRFDLAGCGDSQGAIRDQATAIWQRDVAAAVRLLAERLPDGTPFGLLGIRMGATLAWTAANTIPDLRWLALWEPVPDGAAWLRERLRQRRVREMLATGRSGGGTPPTSSMDGQSLDVDGFNLSPRLARDIENTGLSKTDRGSFAGAVLLLQIGAASRPTSVMESLHARLCRVARDTEIRCLRSPPFWNRLEPHPCPEAGAITLDWLKGVLPVAGDGCDAKMEAASVPRRAGVVTQPEHDGGVGEQPVEFGSAGRRLRGIFHSVAGNRGAANLFPAVLFLHGWGAYRIGPHRMFVHAARCFAARAIPVLRFDFGGRGDSEGATEQATIDTMTVDAALALDALRAGAPGQPLIVLGMCSGAKVAAALAAARATEIDGVIFWSPEPPDEAEQATGGVKAARRRGDVVAIYLRKLLRPAVWRKAWAGGINWRLVHQALLGKRGPKNSERDRDRAVYQAFATYPGRRLLVYGSADPTADTARKQHRCLAQSAGAAYRERGIDGADHNFYHADWERAVIEMTAEWLKN